MESRPESLSFSRMACDSAAVEADAIVRSWERSRRAGLRPESARLDPPHFSMAELRAVTQTHASLISQARPVIDYIYGQIRDSGCVILLSDENGVLLDSIGDAGFCNRAAQVALQPGACWAEDARGTNAVGTALVEGRPVVVNGAEHYLRHNNFLACAAAPLAAPNGKLLGVLDISCDYHIYHPHTFSLVRAAAQMIENRIFELSYRNDMKLRFHLSSGGLGSVVEGVLALSPDGRILAANRNGLDLLNLTPDTIRATKIASLFGVKLPELIDRDRHSQGRPVHLHYPAGGDVFVQIDYARLPFTHRKVEPAQPRADALEALNTGDPDIAKAIGQVRRVLGRKVPILLQGETGAGKDYFARAIHAAGPRLDGPFIAVNCAALPETLIESELFGHSGGAFTGARREGAAGRIREAHGGTLFLDEIGDMPVLMQTRLLRVLEDSQVTPLGGKPVPVDFLLISATNCDLKSRIAAGAFRADLYYRLQGLGLTLKPLRERADIAVIIGRILQAESLGRGAPIGLSPAVQSAFMAYEWPGNLRQLSGMLRTACLMLEPGETVIDWPHLSDDAANDLTCKPVFPQPSGASLRACSDAAIRNAVVQAGGNIAAAARTLRISRNTLYRRLNGSHQLN